MIARARAVAAARHAVAAVVPEGQPGGPAGPVPDAELRRRCRCRRSTTTRRPSWRSGCRWSRGVAQVNVFGAQKFAVRIDLDPTQLAARQIGIDQVAQAIAGANVNRPDRHAVRPEPQLRRADERPADGRRGVTARFVVAYRNGSPVRLERSRATSTTASRTRATPSWFNGTPTHLSRRSSASPARTPSKSSIAIKALLPRAAGAAAGGARSSAIRSDRSVVDPRVGPRRQVHAGPDRRPRRAGHLPVPAEPLGDDHPEPGAAVLDRRHVRGDVGARLQPRQPVADGADALGRLRRRRRDRHAREHRPPHGDGQAAHAGGARRIEGDRVHDRVDDGVARRGVHPDPVHGRHRRPPDARVRGHDRGGDSGLRPRVADADADAVQPLPEAARTR